jgi:GDP-mannose 6-dehydrogenase
MRSTVLPGTVRQVVIPALETASGKKAGRDFGVAMNPEFLRESTSVSDFHNPPKTVIGALSKSDADAVAALYDGLPGPLIKTSIEVAEMVKYVDNVFHALKVTFSNEIGDICKALGIDSHEVMNIFCQDTKLNISPYYLKPGFAFGGSCLPKDVRALTYKASRLDVNTPLLNAIIPSNQNHIEVGLKRIMSFEKKKIGFLGFGFKAGTDDLRESPVVELIERLLGKGCDIKIYDRNVSLARLFGANKQFIEQKIPHISKLMVSSVKDVLSHAEVVVIGNNAPEFRQVFDQHLNGQVFVDLVRARGTITESKNYEGICW